MRRTALAVILLVSLPEVIEAEARAGDEEMAGYAFGKSYTISVTREALRRAPAWDESAENPPLSARRALKLATECQRALVAAPADWEWHLMYLGLRQNNGRWYWLANFEAYPTRHAFDGVAPNLYVAVLMDGTVVKPVIRNKRR
jgi:hypothetical protein